MAEDDKPKEKMLYGYPESYYENDGGLDPNRKAAPLSKDAAVDLAEYLKGLGTEKKAED